MSGVNPRLCIVFAYAVGQSVPIMVGLFVQSEMGSDRERGWRGRLR